MARIAANGVKLNYDRHGQGEPLVLVHGSWSDRNNWLPVVPGLAEDVRRRGLRPSRSRLQRP